MVVDHLTQLIFIWILEMQKTQRGNLLLELWIHWNCDEEVNPTKERGSTAWNGVKLPPHLVRLPNVLKIQLIGDTKCQMQNVLKIQLVWRSNWEYICIVDSTICFQRSNWGSNKKLINITFHFANNTESKGLKMFTIDWRDTTTSHLFYRVNRRIEHEVTSRSVGPAKCPPMFIYLVVKDQTTYRQITTHAHDSYF